MEKEKLADVLFVKLRMEKILLLTLFSEYTIV